MNKAVIHSILFLILTLLFHQLTAQISPGELTRAHARLEGLTNCTKCHILGQKETTPKCLECHVEIKNLMDAKRGYHASSEVKGKECRDCHGEHFGRNYQIVRMNENTFNHNLTGYELTGKHAQMKCAGCHNPQLIQYNISQKKEGTFLGLGKECLSCHEDYHQKTLPANCLSCHNQDAFRPASGFNHAKTRFPLIGKHQSVDCAECHQTDLVNGKQFQRFAGIDFANCTSCHEDVHRNKFGNDCRKCHNEFSFNEVKSLGSFNHNQTAFPLLGMHRVVDCKECHSSGYTQPVKHNYCSDCHADFHENQFVKKGKSPDCAECHSVNGFLPSSFGIERHNQLIFKLEGAHLATPCFSCHLQDEKWNFTGLGARCVTCHENIHQNVLPEKYMPESDCKACHSVGMWNEILFDHNKTNFQLLGKHTQVDCRGCHFRETNGMVKQQFSNLAGNCENCHEDVHFKQFEESGKNDCERCHTFTNWLPEKFNHDNARFKLDGKHAGLECILCHKPTDSLIRSYIIYKFDDISCASCH